jgi:hypothetical protein
MFRSMLIVMGAIAFVGPFSTAQVSTVQYVCDIGGMQAQLTAQVEVVGGSGRVVGPDGTITGVIGTGDSNVYYQGQLVSQTASYTFTGENEYADFTESNTYERFRARMQIQGNYLVITVNPFGPQPVQYGCQQVG